MDASLSIDNNSGVNIDQNPITPEKVWKALIKAGSVERN
jgi:hypothetical protein